MEAHKKLLLANKAWASDMALRKPGFFESLAKDQNPDFLWVGCSDSRVPAEEITGTQPGDVFVHRNIANLVIHSDINLLSVLQYAVDVLKVKNIIVCGHYGCGGVRAAMAHGAHGILSKWLYYIKDCYFQNEKELEALNESARMDRMVELNVMHQIHNLSRMSIIQKAWKYRGGPKLHGWVYGLNDGLLRELNVMGPDSKVPGIFEFKESL